MSEYEGLTDEEVAAESELLKGVPFFNIGALFLPPVWGPAHGRWLTILWYPLWMFADNLFFGAYSNPSALSVVLALLAFVLLAAFTFLFARLMQPYALHRALDAGKTKEQYLHTERIWAIVSVVVGALMLAFATYYNLAVRPGLG